MSEPGQEMQARIAWLRDRIEYLEAENAQLRLAMAEPIDNIAAVRMTGSEGKVLGVLLARDYATRDAIWTALYWDRLASDHQPDDKIVDVLVCKLRRKLAPYGIAIKNNWGVGWCMTADSKARVRELTQAKAAA